jgi:hypothetical protein
MLPNQKREIKEGGRLFTKLRTEVAAEHEMGGG